MDIFNSMFDYNYYFVWLCKEWKTYLLEFRNGLNTGLTGFKMEVLTGF